MLLERIPGQDAQRSLNIKANNSYIRISQNQTNQFFKAHLNRKAELNGSYVPQSQSGYNNSLLDESLKGTANRGFTVITHFEDQPKEGAVSDIKEVVKPKPSAIKSREASREGTAREINIFRKVRFQFEDER